MPDFMQGLIKENILQYVTAGKSCFTVVSMKTGQRFTYKVNKSDREGFFFVSVLCGSDNYSNYKYIGIIQNNLFRYGIKSKISEDSLSVIAFKWFMQNIGSNYVQVWHDGTCAKCGRKLTVPSSIMAGIGPECMKIINKPHYHLNNLKIN